MNNRRRRVLHLIAGMYLIYLAFNLISQQLKSPTSNAAIAIGAGVVFAIFGLVIIVRYVKNSIKDYNEENSKIMKYKDFSFYTHKTWTTRYGRKYSSTCVKIPWRDMCACDIKTKVFDFGLSYPIK